MGEPEGRVKVDRNINDDNDGGPAVGRTDGRTTRINESTGKKGRRL